MSVRRRTGPIEAASMRLGSSIISMPAAPGASRLLSARKREADAYESEVKVQVRDGIHTAPSASPYRRRGSAKLANVRRRRRQRKDDASNNMKNMSGCISCRVSVANLAHLTMPAIEAFRDDLLSDLSRPMAKKVLTSAKINFEGRHASRQSRSECRARCLDQDSLAR